ncbi:MAG: SpoIID/LytB domain-containing protein [Leptolyngbya sp. SIO4C1]|nr:SpoIID/LytB domain-containing protein [Leptolyngbya sp. SIO4C1]
MNSAFRLGKPNSLLQLLASRGRLGLGSLLLWFVWLLPAQALDMRVAISNGAEAVDIGSSTPGILRDASGEAIYQLPQLQRITVDAENGELELTDGQADFAESRAFWLEPSADGFVWIDDRWYRGRVLVVPSEAGLMAINYVDLEHYLYSVVGSEMPSSWPQAALQAQAVAARSYALYHRDRATGRLYDMGGTQAWQVYRGLSGEAPSTISAVQATAGQVLTYGGRIIEAVFHSSSGGYTENSEEVWSSAVPYLKSVEDFDQDAPVYRWQAVFSIEDISARLPGIGQVQELKIIERSASGRVKYIEVIGDEGGQMLKGSELRRALGLRSTKFEVLATADGFEINGYGFGHGIGLSQWGAHGMAQRGQGYDTILNHFYQGTALARVEAQ